jgi:phage-related protein
MALAVYDWVESNSSAVTVKPRTVSIQYGDGYEQRAPDGINTRTEQWTVLHNMTDPQIAMDIDAFLTARNGVEAFEWWPRWATAAIKVKCTSWNLVHREQGVIAAVDITAVFERVYAP